MKFVSIFSSVVLLNLLKCDVLAFTGHIDAAFVNTSPCSSLCLPRKLRARAEDENETAIDPFRLVGSMFTSVKEMAINFDDVVDDFFNKRMGNGEIFYGKRKFDPSGRVEGQYNGLGLSDHRKIEGAREYREKFFAELDEKRKQLGEE